MAAKAADASTMITKTTHSVRVPVLVAYSKVGRSGMIVGKAVSDGCPDEVEVGTRRVEVFLSISIGSIMMAVWVLMEVVCGWSKKR